ncbi:SRPBCC domain-containing protein [Nocardia yunnanensis]|uniref:SRPBCC domain-containing protein n=1 Tax=Nocardia yunnanensis TaxID=2382165 RepID=A0A386ZGX1_9NOCA|nr:SRPBCC domain-containing protein [Nocardia yunnanensis]AYF76443.1 SRPBCC domain-containing protein [Nocardia yunnanensis]
MAFVIDRTVEIDAPAELVWQVLTDVDRYGEWNPFCLECKTTLEPGSPIDMKVRLVGPKPKRQREFIRTHTPGTEFSYSMKPVPLGLLSSERSHTVTSLEGGRTRYVSHFQLQGALAPVVSGLLGKALTTGFEGMTNAVKTRAEALKSVRD